jgi:anti-sigma regulatory factor (Ser/Thr protein kinase)
VSDEGEWQTLDAFSVPSEVGNEIAVLERVSTAVTPIQLPDRQLEQLKTAVAEAAMNAMEHGNHYQAEIPIRVQVLASPSDVAVRISDEGGASELPEPQIPDLAAKLAGEQSPRGWGLYLIKNLVDEMRVSLDGQVHTIELIVKRQGATNASQDL